MNLTQNDRLKQITSDTLIVGVDVGLQHTFTELLTGEGLNAQEECLSLAVQAWDFLDG